jgi:predicted ATP-grasp superfamily ATP-dependent carboligase
MWNSLGIGTTAMPDSDTFQFSHTVTQEYHQRTVNIQASISRSEAVFLLYNSEIRIKPHTGYFSLSPELKKEISTHWSNAEEICDKVVNRVNLEAINGV